jgi:hypothetical protein
MSEENNSSQTTEETQEQNPSTQASENNVPYDRFQEVNAQKKEYANQVGALQAQIDKMNQSQKQQQEAKMIEDGKLKEALDIVTKERDEYKNHSEQWNQYQTDKRDTLMSQLTDDTDKSIAEGLTDLNKLETYVNKTINVSAPSTSSARAATGKTGDFGGYSSYAEWATKDPKGYQEANQTIKGTGIKIGYGD